MHTLCYTQKTQHSLAPSLLRVQSIDIYLMAIQDPAERNETENIVWSHTTDVGGHPTVQFNTTLAAAKFTDSLFLSHLLLSFKDADIKNAIVQSFFSLQHGCQVLINQSNPSLKWLSKQAVCSTSVCWHCWVWWLSPACINYWFLVCSGAQGLRSCGIWRQHLEEQLSLSASVGDDFSPWAALMSQGHVHVLVT